MFASLIERGQEEGLYRTDIPRAVLVAHFFTDVHYLSHWYSPEGPEDKALLAEQLTDLFLVGDQGLSAVRAWQVVPATASRPRSSQLADVAGARRPVPGRCSSACARSR